MLWLLIGARFVANLGSFCDSLLPAVSQIPVFFQHEVDFLNFLRHKFNCSATLSHLSIKLPFSFIIANRDMRYFDVTT